MVKAGPWDDIIFRYEYRNEVLYPTDHDLFSEFFIFKNIFIHIFMNPMVTQTNFLYT